MDIETIGAIAKAFSELTLAGFLFMNWWLERGERLRIQAARDAHYESDIAKLDDTVEALQKGG